MRTVRRTLGWIVALAVIAGLAAAALSQLPAWQLLEARAFDHLSMIAPPQRPAGTPLVVAIDEPSFAEIGQQWPWPRDTHARLVEALRGAGARTSPLRPPRGRTRPRRRARVRCGRSFRRGSRSRSR